MFLHSMSQESSRFLSCVGIYISASVWYLYLCWCAGTYRVGKAKSVTPQFICSCGPPESISFICLLQASFNHFVYWLISFNWCSEFYTSFTNNFTLFSMLGTHYVMFSLFYWKWYVLVNLFSVLCQLNCMFNLLLSELYRSWNTSHKSSVFSHLLLV